MYITQNDKYETQCFIRVTVPVGTSASARLKNRHREWKRTRKLVQSYNAVLGRRPIAKVDHMRNTINLRAKMAN